MNYNLIFGLMYDKWDILFAMSKDEECHVKSRELTCLEDNNSNSDLIGLEVIQDKLVAKV